MGATVLIYKKGNSKDSSNYIPITYQTIWYKIYFSVYLNMMSNCLLDNGSVDQSLQKGFWCGIDSVTEHTSLLAHIMKDAKRKQ